MKNIEILSVLISFFFIKITAQDAIIVSYDIPDTVITNQVFHVKITMRNTGNIPWGEGEENTGATLVSKNPNFNTTWGTYFITMSQGNTVASGQTYCFESYLMAPSTPGTYNFSWQCQNWLPEGGYVDTTTNFFGEILTDIYITVIQRQELPPEKPQLKATSIDSSDFEYIGSFKLPGLPGYEQTFTASGLALKKSGNKKNLLIMTGTYDFALYEVEIPELIKPVEGEMSELNTASVITNWGALDCGNIGGEYIQPNAGFWYDNDENILYWTHYNFYFPGGSSDFPVLMSTRLNTDGTKTNLNYWYLPNPLEAFKGYWGGIIKLSDNFAQTYTGGKKFALGFGGYFNMCASASRGPALGAISKPEPGDSVLNITPIMYYPDPVACPRPGNYFSNIGYWDTQPTAPWEGWWAGVDLCRAGVLIDLPDKKGYMAFAYQGIGRLGYDFGGYNADGKYQHCWYFYDLEDLGNAASGNSDPTTLLPVRFYEINYPIEGDFISGACFDEDTRNLYLYSVKPVIHVYHLKESSVGLHKNAETTDYFLSQNYPNPFNSSTIISYQLPIQNMVSLKIFDILGQEIITLVNEYKFAGTYTVEWNGTNSAGHKVTNGIYYYQLKTANNYLITKKMIILR